MSGLSKSFILKKISKADGFFLEIERIILWYDTLMKTNDLTQGNIYSQLIRLSLPLMGTALIQMSYNLMDMFWLGKLSTHSLAASAAVGYISWLAMAFVLMIRTGTEIGVGQSVGAKKTKETQEFITTSLVISVFIGTIYALSAVALRTQLIGLFRFQEEIIRQEAYKFLLIVVLGYPFFFLNPIIGGIYHGAGNSKTPFIVNSVGLMLNMVLDPLFIFTLDMGIQGAALATALANFSVSLIYFLIRKKVGLLANINLIKDFCFDKVKRILSWGYPAAVYNIFFVSVSTVISRQVTAFSSGAFAAFEVGVQIEAIGWMMFGGLATTLGVFVAQNYGAENYERMLEGYHKGTKIASVIGFVALLALYFFSGQLMGLFIKDDPYALSAGMNYLRIVALCQVFSSWEASSQGGFNGLGKTKLPSVVGVLTNLSRIPLSYFLKGYFGLNGIWIALSISAGLRGIFLRVLFHFEKKRYLVLVEEEQ